MAWDQVGFSIGELAANQDLSAQTAGGIPTYQFVPVAVVASSGTGVATPAAVDLVSSSGDPALGILQNNPALGEAANVMVSGVSKAKAVETITVGQLLMAVPTGLGVATSSKYIIAQALESASAGSIFSVVLRPMGLKA